MVQYKSKMNNNTGYNFVITVGTEKKNKTFTHRECVAFFQKVYVPRWRARDRSKQKFDNPETNVQSEKGEERERERI